MPDRPRVLQLGPDPEMSGGMAAVLRGLLTSPLADRYQLDVVPTYRGPAPLQRLTVFCAALLRLSAWSLRGRGRIVQIHVTVRGSMYRKAVCVLLARALRRRVVLHVHSGAVEIASFRASLGRSSLALFRAAFAASDVVLAVSAASSAALEEAYGLTGVVVVPNAAPPGPPERRGPQSDGGQVQAVYLGGFANPVKGGGVLLEALAIAIPRAPGLNVTLAGPGELPPSGAKLIERHPQISWVGWLQERVKDEQLRAAEIFVMSSLSEGLPVALLEAMAYELAIVTTAVGGIPEVTTDREDGLLVPPGDPQALADALCALTGDAALRTRLSAAARDRAERLDAVEVTERLSAIYAGLG
ncbi:MAG TPA: glycosyltransferase family 4 protein [Thermoleophilaceae bacterium]|nr:glycosyltransferase family 4 protein [Thermoleophilaceae bacterium]